MNVKPIIDAGPGLNFLSIRKERLLIEVLGEISAPETVQDEVLRKSQQDDRFSAAATVWRKMTPRWIQILPDDVTPELVAVVQRVSGLPMGQRKGQPKDLGETMVIAHAVVAAESGQSVTILMDDGLGAKIATSEIGRLRRLGSSGRPVGSITLASTLTVLGRAAGTKHLPDRTAMRETYNRLRGLDDGLPPIGNTDLLAPKFWS
ncbi:MAG TPA: hypothetical protein VGH27_11350 [Streptosporangiaceae bacterium]|jgi:hypothetical protein